LWLKEKLRRSGIRSIDPVVDVTNYVLLELGHPMHAFDNNQLAGTVTVRYAKAGETLTLLDGNQVDLQTNTLVIADDQKPLAIAGVFGGLDSGVTSETSDIFLESAFFHPDAILGKARQYGLHTDASHRYERGVDPQLQRDAMERATQLLLDIVGGQAGPIVEAVSESHIPQAKEVILRHSRLSRVLGIEIDGNTVSDILSRLGFEPALNGANTAKQLWTVSIPAYRFDVSIEEDLIEEVARVFGYNSIPEVSPVGRLNMTPRPEGQLKLSDLKRRLTERDYQEAITYSFVDPQKQHILHSDIQGKMLPHPISADMSVMRVSLWTGLLQAVGYNQNRQQARVRLFESGLRFVPDANDKTGVRQEPVIAGVIAGNRHTEYWENNDRVVDFFDAKADLEALLSQFVSTDDIVFKSASHSALHPGQTAAIYQADRLIGYLGTLHPKLEKPFELNGRTIIWELHLDGLSELPIPKAREISRYPANRRDIAIVVKDEVLSGELIAYMKNCGEKHLVAVNLFDLYQGKGIEEGYKSLAISLIFQDVERTLEEQEIQNGVAKLLHGLKDKFGAILRD
jgi:phenylalanyl-tRNA synthetase beta chain